MKPKPAAALCLSMLALAAFSPRGVAAPAPPRVWEVRMEMNGTTPRFSPSTLTIHPGDRVRFINVSGGPHNVSIDSTGVPADMRRVLAAAMADQIQPLWGRLLLTPNDSYTISFAGVKPGRYQFFCMPHMSVGMRGSIVVR
jgi:plastocyanin